MTSSAANQWTKFYTENAEMMYPAEAVIRIFKGTYPKLTIPKPQPGESILDVGCGDGRHFPLFASLGMKMAGTEITAKVIDAIKPKLNGLDVDLRVGTCAKLPWPKASFRYLLAWNSCYYMSRKANFETHVSQMARVLEPGGWLICSIPSNDSFIFNDAEDECGTLFRYVIIRNDYFGLRNGQRMRRFDNAMDICKAFEPHFTNFSWANIEIDMFGLAYNWHVFTAERRT